MRKLPVILAFSIVVAFAMVNTGCDSDQITPTHTYTPTSTSPSTTTPASIPTVTATQTQTQTPTATAGPTITTAPTTTGLFLEVSQPSDGAQVSTSAVTVAGKTIPEAVVSLLINEEIEIADVDQNGNFNVTVYLEEGPNLLEVVASDQYGNGNSVTIVVMYAP